MRLDLFSFVLPGLFSAGNRVSQSTHVNPIMGLPMSSTSEEFDNSPLNSTLLVSNIVYEFESLRSIVSKHEKTFNEHLSDEEKKKVGIVAFDTPALVDTRNSVDKKFPATKLNNPITAAAILEFLQRNKQYICHKEGVGKRPQFAKEGDNRDDIFLAKKLEALRENFDADIVEFDDEFAESGLASALIYSIVVNRSKKRIDVVFRGSISIKDFLVDFRFFSTSPKIIKEFTGNKNVRIHKGFSDYLLAENYAEGKPKIDQILDVLEQVYKNERGDRDYSNYELYITGHSLGGSLSQLLAFVLAGSERASFIPKPITAITFASPVVGKEAFRKEFQALECDNKLRHIRVSNQNDVMPGTIFGYTQTGVNMHVKEGEKMEVGYRNSKSIVSQVNPFKSPSSHSLFKGNSYHKNLYAKDENGHYLNNDDLVKSVEQLYDDYAGDYTE